MRHLAGVGAAAVAIGIVVMSSGCGGGSKAGGAGGKHTIVLTLASQIRGGPPEQLTSFAEEVRNRSGGTVRIEFKDNWRAADLRQELDTIRDVKAAKVELAWVGARAWDWVGVRSFDPLVAPLLIDSYALEQRVFESGIPREMLAGTKAAGVVGIGVLPGPMRKLLGVHRPLVDPRDFAGLTIGVQGIVAAETVRALGARPRQVFAQTQLGGLDGIEEQMGAIVGNEHDEAARYLTADLNLWPRPLVIFASPKIFRALNPKQQQALRDGASAAVSEAMAASKQEDAAGAQALCTRGKVVFADVTPAKLASLRSAIAPVYAQLERDPDTRHALRRIEALKRGIPSAAPIPCAGGAKAPGQHTASALEGAWEMSVRRGDLLGNPAYEQVLGRPPTEEDLTLDVGTYRLALHGGRFRSSHDSSAEHVRDSGTFRIEGDTVVFRITSAHSAGEVWAYRWSVYRDALTFRKPSGKYQVGPPNQMFAPWHRVGQ
jgi:TRAP-type C4-dicarboxylate transport system substrate-binding protein